MFARCPALYCAPRVYHILFDDQREKRIVQEVPSINYMCVVMQPHHAFVSNILPRRYNSQAWEKKDRNKIRTQEDLNDVQQRRPL